MTSHSPLQNENGKLSIRPAIYFHFSEISAPPMQRNEPEQTSDFTPSGDLKNDAGRLDDVDFLSVWQSYQARLRHFLEGRIPNNLQTQTTASDVMQSAFLSLWRYFEKQDGPIQLGDEELWGLLVTIASRKLANKWRKVLAKKRGEGKVVSATDLQAQRKLAFDQYVVRQMNHELTELMDELKFKLDEECQVIVSMRLAGMTNPEIATALNCSVRRVERKLVLIRSALSDSYQDKT